MVEEMTNLLAGNIQTRTSQGISSKCKGYKAKCSHKSNAMSLTFRTAIAEI